MVKIAKQRLVGQEIPILLCSQNVLYAQAKLEKEQDARIKSFREDIREEAEAFGKLRADREQDVVDMINEHIDEFNSSWSWTVIF